MDVFCTCIDSMNVGPRPVTYTAIDVINVFYVLYSGHVFLRFVTFSYFFHVFYFKKNVVNAKCEY